MISKSIGKHYIPTNNTTISHLMSRKIKNLSSDETAYKQRRSVC